MKKENLLLTALIILVFVMGFLLGKITIMILEDIFLKVMIRIMVLKILNI